MIDLYYWTTPNGNKVLLFLEEARLDYKIHEINIGKGDQFTPKFLKIAPNNRIPAIVDHAPKDLAQPISIFESGAILWYLAKKINQFIPNEQTKEIQVLEWLMWQMGGLGPMFGQAHHFRLYANEEIPYAIERYTNETTRLYNVLNKRLAGRDYVVDEYSIADMAMYHWTLNPEGKGQDINNFPKVKAWQERIANRDAVKRVDEIANAIRENNKKLSDDAAAKQILFGQTDTKSPT